MSLSQQVLIVDDSPPIRDYMQQCLAELGFSNITQVEHGLAALAFCQKKLPDIITLDWNMPAMNGYTFLRELRKLPDGEKPIVVFCSTESSSGKIKMVMEAGANEYITKPFTIYDVREKLELLGVI